MGVRLTFEGVLDSSKYALDTLSENFKSLLQNPASCDTILLVKDKEYRAHKAVLIARSSVFAAMPHPEVEENGMTNINIPDSDPDSFGEFLKFLYCGKFEEFSSCKVFALYETSDKYNAEDMKAFCCEYLMDNLTARNVCETAIFAVKYDDKNLKLAVQEFFNENVNDIFKTSEWECFLENEVSLAKNLLKEMAKVKFTK